MKQILIILLSVLSILVYAQMKLVIQTGNIIKTEFHNTENYLFTADNKGAVVIWDLNKCKQYSSYTNIEGINGVCFAEEGIITVAQQNQLVSYNF